MAELGVLLLSYVAGTLLPVLSDAAKSVGGVHLWQCLSPHQRVDLVFREPVPWRADPASLDGFGDERGGLLSEFPDLLVGELVFGEVGETSGFMW